LKIEKEVVYMCWMRQNWKWIVATAAFVAWILATPLLLSAVSSLIPGFERVVEAFVLKPFHIWR